MTFLTDSLELEAGMGWVFSPEPVVSTGASLGVVWKTLKAGNEVVRQV